MTMLVPQILFLLIGASFWVFSFRNSRKAIQSAEVSLEHYRNAQKLNSESMVLIANIEGDLAREKSNVAFLKSLCDTKVEKLNQLEQMALQLADDMTGSHVLDVLYRED